MDKAWEAGNLNAFIVVINGTAARDTVNIRNTLARMRSSMPDAFLKNLLVVLTNCSSVGFNFALDSLKPWVIPKENVFHMDNLAFSTKKDTWANNQKVSTMNFFSTLEILVSV